MTDQQEPTQALTRRITGIETEFGITLTLDDSHRLGPDEIVRYVFRLVIARYGATNIFTPSAGRMYLDVGSHPEYAATGCDSASQLVTYDHSGEVILNELAKRAEIELADEGIDGKVYLLKNDVDIVGNSYGCHEDYLVGRELGLKFLSKLLLPSLVTRQLICDAGKIFLPYPTSSHHNDPIRCCFSQRTNYVWEGVSSATTCSRPIINTRDEPRMDSNRSRRLHIIVGDSNMSEAAATLKIGSAQLVLEVIEAGVKLPDFEAANEIKSVRAVNRDMTGRTEVSLRSGETATALQIQRGLLDTAAEWLKVREENMVNEGEGIADVSTSNEEMSRIIELWGRALDVVEAGSWSLIEHNINWATKYLLMKRCLDRSLTLEDPRLHQIDLAYHDIHPGRGIFRTLEARGIASRWITDGQATEAIRTAPPTTRAKLCGDFLVAVKDSSLKTIVDQAHLKISGDDPISTILGGPFATESDEVNEMIEILTVAKKTSDTDSDNQFHPRRLPQEEELHNRVYLAGTGKLRTRCDQ